MVAEAGVVAFLCAMPMELQPLRRRLGLRPATVAGAAGFAGSIAGRPVVATVTGMGTERAADATRRLLDALTVNRVVVVGISGAVDDVVPIGTLVVPELVVDAASGARHRPAPLGGLPPHGTLWTTDVLVTDVAAADRLRTRGVVALDMETAAVADVCDRGGVAWSVVRAISDRATDGSVDDAVLGLSHPDGSPNPAAVARYVVTRPHRVPTLVRLARGSRRAAVRAAASAAAAVAADLGG